MGETANDGGAEGEAAINSQAKGPDLDGTLERYIITQEATLRWRRIFQVKRQRRRNVPYGSIRVRIFLCVCLFL